MIDHNKLDKIVDKLGDIPVIPIVAERVIYMVQDPNTTSSELQAVIETDQALTARLLKMANSAFYGFRGKINTINHAIMVLGFKTLKSVVLAASLRGVYKRFGLIEELLWEQSLFVSVSCRNIAQVMKMSDAEDAFITGLMHNMGMVIMNNEMPDDFNACIQRFYNEDIPLIDLQKEMYGFSHMDVAAVAIRKWKLPDFIAKVVLYQDNPAIFAKEDPVLFRLASMVYTSDKFCYKLGIGLGQGRKKEFDLSQDSVIKSLKVPGEDIEGLMNSIYETYQDEKSCID